MSEQIALQHGDFIKAIDIAYRQMIAEHGGKNGFWCLLETNAAGWWAMNDHRAANICVPTWGRMSVFPLYDPDPKSSPRARLDSGCSPERHLAHAHFESQST